MGSDVSREIIQQRGEVIGVCPQKGCEIETVMASFSIGQAYPVKGETGKGQKTVADVELGKKNFDFRNPSENHWFLIAVFC